jgi:hypothetical protein
MNSRLPLQNRPFGKLRTSFASVDVQSAQANFAAVDVVLTAVYLSTP